jgi:hypothetical protein
MRTPLSNIQAFFERVFYFLLLFNYLISVKPTVATLLQAQPPGWAFGLQAGTPGWAFGLQAGTPGWAFGCLGPSVIIQC